MGKVGGGGNHRPGETIIESEAHIINYSENILFGWVKRIRKSRTGGPESSCVTNVEKKKLTLESSFQKKEKA